MKSFKPKIDPEALRTIYNGITLGEKEGAILNGILGTKKPIKEGVANYVMPRARIELLKRINVKRKMSGDMMERYVSFFSQLYHFLSYSIRKPKMQLEKAMLIVSMMLMLAAENWE